MVLGQNSLPSESKKEDIFIANNSFHVVGDALVLGNIKSIEVGKEKKSEKPKELLSRKRSKDNIEILKEKRAKKVVTLRKPIFFVLPFKSENAVSLEKQFRRMLFSPTDSYSYQKGKAVAGKFRFTFQNYIFKEVLVCNSDFLIGYQLQPFDYSIIARPPPAFV
jgi:hypothetical protein